MDIDLKDPIDKQDSFFEFIGRFSGVTGEIWTPTEHTAARVAALRLPDLEDPHWQTVSKLLNRPWFSRVWMIQEYTLSKDPKFVLGDLYISRLPAQHPVSSMLFCYVGWPASFTAEEIIVEFCAGEKD